MNEIKMCGIVLTALIICIVFKNIRQEYTLFVRVLITIFVSAISIGALYPIFSFLDEIAKNTPVYKYIPILIKALVVAFAVQITADVCNDAQEIALSERISLFGKIEILILSMPLIKNLFELCKNIVS